MRMAWAFSIVLFLGLAGCGGGNDTTTVVAAETFSVAWYDVYHEPCGRYASGCDYFKDGNKATVVNDPHFSGFPGPDYHPPGWTEFGDNQYWLSPSGVIYDPWGNAMNEEEKTSSRNVVGDVASEEMKTITTAGVKLSERYSVSLEAGLHMAKLFNSWAIIGKSRARTSDDVNAFTKRLYGIDAGEIHVSLSAAAKGEMKPLERSISEVASSWGTTPEMVKAMQKNWFAPQLKSYGY